MTTPTTTTTTARFPHIALWSAETHFAGCLSEDVTILSTFAAARDYLAELAETEAEYTEGELDAPWLAADWRTLAAMIRATADNGRPVTYGAPRGTLVYELAPVTGEDEVIAHFRETDELGEDIPDAAIIAWLDHGNTDCAGLRDAYRGEWKSVAHYVESLLEDGCVDGYDPSTTAGRYFDVWSFARDLVLGGDIWTHEDGYESVFVFSAY